MSHNPPERITPLPWKIMYKVIEPYTDTTCPAWGYFCQRFGIEGRFLGWIYGKTKEEQEANAAYIVHACNNYPKLEALNMELVEALEFVLENYGVPSHIYDSGRHKAIVETLQKAKGG